MWKGGKTLGFYTAASSRPPALDSSLESRTAPRPPPEAWASHMCRGPSPASQAQGTTAHPSTRSRPTRRGTRTDPGTFLGHSLSDESVGQKFARAEVHLACPVSQLLLQAPRLAFLPRIPCQFPQESREAGTWHHHCRSTEAVQHVEGAPTLAGGHRLSEPRSQGDGRGPRLPELPADIYGAPAVSIPQATKWGVQSARMDAALLEPTDRHGRWKRRPTQ